MYDTHTHLQETVYDSVRMAYLDDLYDSGVNEVMIASYDIPSSLKAFQIKTSYTGSLKLHIAAGIHPSYIEENPVGELEKYIMDTQFQRPWSLLEPKMDSGSPKALYGKNVTSRQL